MRKILLVLTIITILSQSLAGFSYAASPTATPTPNQAITSEINQQINNLKDKIASKVAQLKLVEKKGIIGMVTDSSNTQITLKDTGGNIHFVDVDELTKFDSSSSKSFGISDVTKGMTIGVLGLYNKESRRILARFVTVLQPPTNIHGAIASIDRTNYTLTVVQNDGTQTVIEIEDVTKTTSYDNGSGVSRSGFSKTQIGERVYIVGFSDKQNAKEIIASRIIIFPGLPVNPAIGSAVPAAPTDTNTPSTAPTQGAKNLTPLK